MKNDGLTKHAPVKLTAQRYAERFDAEKAKLARHYCTLFKFWRSCALRRCRKARRCCGDQKACLQRRGNEVPREVQWHARQQILISTPASAGPPERMAREFLAGDLYR